MNLWFEHLKRYKKQTILGPIFKMTEAVFELIIPFAMSVLIDSGIAAGNLPSVFRTGGFMLLLAALGLGSALVCQYYASVASQGFGTELRNRMFRHITGFSHAETDRFPPAALLNRLTADIEQMQLAVAMTVRLGIRVPLLCIGGVAAAMFIDFRLSLIILAAVPIFTLFLRRILTRSSKLFRRVQARGDTLARTVSENLDGVRVIRAFGAGRRERRRFDSENDGYRRAYVRALSASALSAPVSGLTVNIGIVLILFFGAKRVNAGDLTKGQIVALVGYMSQILLALAVAANLVDLYVKAAAAAARVREVLGTEPAVREPDRPRPVPVSADLVFENVRMRYEGGENDALRGVSFQAVQGEVIGVVGLTGSGKSTLVGLIPRFYDPAEGRILYGGTDLREFDLAELRRRIVFVSQKAEIFSGTLFSRIQMGDEAVDEAAALRGADAAGAEFVRVKGLSSPVRRDGANLSGGQRQRLALAAALAREPAVLILDDAFSALDTLTAARIRKGLYESKAGRITFIVSQRYTDVRDADRILVIDEGEIADMGTHEELSERCPVYRGIRDASDFSAEGGEDA